MTEEVLITLKELTLEELRALVPRAGMTLYDSELS